MFAFAGLRAHFGSLQIDGNEDAGLCVFREKVAPAVSLDFIGPGDKPRAVHLERPRFARQPDIGFCRDWRILRASRYDRKQHKSQDDEETDFHAELRSRGPSAHSTRQVAAAVESKSSPYRMKKHPLVGEKIPVKNSLLRDFVEGEDFVAQTRHGSLDPATAVVDAIAS